VLDALVLGVDTEERSITLSVCVSTPTRLPCLCPLQHISAHPVTNEQVTAQFSSPFGPIAPPSAAATSGRRGEIEGPYGTLRIETGGNNNRTGAGGIIHRNPWASLKSGNSAANSDDSEDRPGVKLT
jgi:hypothetical protein